MEYDVIIVGAGASGLMAAVVAARKGCSVLVIEQKEKAGKKILATGNGKCNFTNKKQEAGCYRSNDSAFPMKVLSCFDVPETIRFFEEIGILTKEKDGYCYPNSEQAASIAAVLLMECRRLKVTMLYNETVKLVKQPYFTVMTEAGGERHSYTSKKMILAAGGCASPKLGSDGSGYALVQRLGHTLIKPLPALVSLLSGEKYCKTISGVRLQASVQAVTDGRQLAGERGEIIFTDYGVSGIPVMQLSRFVSKAIDRGENVRLKIDLLPDKSKEELADILHRRIEQNPAKNIEEMMVGLLNHKLSYLILLQAKLDLNQPSGTLKEKAISGLIKNMKEFEMNIRSANTFDHAQVTAGGIQTSEIHPQTMESKVVRGLYFAGEIVDVDGTCGGYNLQWAWSSGYLAGQNAGM